MKNNNSEKPYVLEDLAGMIGGVAGIVSDMRSQFKDDARSRMKDMADKAELASLSDIERLESILNDLTKRVEALELQANKKK
jgi:polyhydroxyalkanoate synthesis regulator phasin